MKTLLIFIIGILAVLGYLIYRDPSFVQSLLQTKETTVQTTLHNIAPSDVTFSGTIKRFQRPEPDIAYDYQIVLWQPVTDIDNASGVNQRVTSYILVPATDGIKQQLESGIGLSAEVSGQMKWGFAESKYISVTKVTLK